MLRPRLALVVALLFPFAAHADDAVDARAVLQRWTDAQLKSDLAAYSALYARTFFGVRRSGPRVVRFDRDGWLKDRERMFRKPMHVETSDVRVTSGDKGVELDFVQRFTQGSFHDEGDKVMTLARQDGALVITSERMLTSRLGSVAGTPISAWRGAIGAGSLDGAVLPWRVDESYGRGPTRTRTKHGREVARRDVSDKAPAEAMALVGKSVEVVTLDGTTHPARVTGLALVAVVQHTVDSVEAGVTGDSTWPETHPRPWRLVAELEPKVAHALVVRAAPAPIVRAQKADAALTKSALARARALPAYKAHGWEVGSDEASKVVTFDVVVAGQPTRWVSAWMNNGGGCADGVDLWALWAVHGDTWTLLNTPRRRGLTPALATDLDGDGWPELLWVEGGYDDLGFDIESGVVKKLGERYDDVDSVRTEYLGCPC